MAGGFSSATPAVLSDVSSFLLTQLSAEEPRVRSCTLDWLKRVFPYNHLPARYACVALAADVRSELQSSAINGLDPALHASFKSLPKTLSDGLSPVGAQLYPSFSAAVLYFTSTGASSPSSPLTALAPPSCVALLSFLEKCFQAQRYPGEGAVVSVSPDACDVYRSIVEHVLGLDPSMAGASAAHEVCTYPYPVSHSL